MNLHYKGPVVLAILDGVGLRREVAGNAVKQAHTEFLNYAVENYKTTSLAASGEAVGILADNMGNSEVGHNTIGSGQIIKQGISQINDAINTGAIWNSEAWKEAIKRVKDNNSTLHFSGIFSDGNVHSSIYHLEKMIDQAHNEGVKKIRIHIVLDGRDTPPQSSLQYVNELEAFIATFADKPDYKIASGGGRMLFVADRYENDWGVVKAGWDAMVNGIAPNNFPSATAAIESFREKDPTIQDQYIPPFVIFENGRPVGLVQDGDSFIYFDFRADRAIEIAQAFTYDDFPYFERVYYDKEDKEHQGKPDVYFVGMTEYNSDTHVPEHRLIDPVKIDEPLNQYLGEHGISQLAVSETVKFGHITYYFNGNSYEKATKEEHIEIPSDTQPFDTRPWMKSAEITDVAIEKMKDYDFVRLNFPGGDMVGHFAELEPTIVAIEAIDIQLARLAKEVDRLGGVLIITADHGNAEELIDSSGASKTAHSTNPVPFIIYDNTENKDSYQLAAINDAGLANIASTISLFLGHNNYPTSWHEPLIRDVDTSE
ncbi:2,3-bisphosphoglycerate-independent phosphoglycerate mutase [Candidatus Saccharibacteria bacterium]|nr:2,3-bisphosphoglycerate-independent phosphoglycerate mutase [Candidatus Saccharibacteria bacterium]